MVSRLSTCAAANGGSSSDDTRWFASHELRTPLNAMRSASELLVDGSLGALAEPARAMVTLIAEAAVVLDARLDELDALSRIENRQCSFETVTLEQLATALRLDLLHAVDGAACSCSAPVGPSTAVRVDIEALAEAMSLCRSLAEADPADRADHAGQADELHERNGSVIAADVVLIGAGTEHVDFRIDLGLPDAGNGEKTILRRSVTLLAQRAGASFALSDDGHVELGLERPATGR